LRDRNQSEDAQELKRRLVPDLANRQNIPEIRQDAKLTGFLPPAKLPVSALQAAPAARR
jgi:hypothetical protein